MKLLCFSDLHLDIDISQEDRVMLSPLVKQAIALVAKNNPDVIVITGDINSPQYNDDLYRLLELMFGSEIPIIATLGNHEFWFHSFEETLDSLRRQKNNAPNNIHFLDIEGSFQTNGHNFVGGCLFFDGSMRILEHQQITPWDGWNDHYIRDIKQRHLEFNRYYVELINANMKPGMSTVLCTHHLPHWKLNGHAPGLLDLGSAFFISTY